MLYDASFLISAANRGKFFFDGAIFLEKSKVRLLKFQRNTIFKVLRDKLTKFIFCQHEAYTCMIVWQIFAFNTRNQHYQLKIISPETFVYSPFCFSVKNIGFMLNKEFFTQDGRMRVLTTFLHHNSHHIGNILTTPR